MGVIWQTSWDYLASADVASLPMVVSATSASIQAGAPVGSYLYLPDRAIKLVFSDTGLASLWIHVRFKATYDANYLFLSLNDIVTGYRQIHFFVDNTYHLRAYRASANRTDHTNVTEGTLLATGAFTFAEGSWYSLAIEVTIDDAAGIVKTWVNEQPDITVTGADTKYTANANVGSILMTEQGGIDDVVIATAVSPNGSFPEELRVDAMRPDANGSDRDWDLSTGTDEYALLDEATPNTTDYIESPAVGERCSVSVQALTNTGGTMYAVSQTMYASKSNAGPCGITPYVKISGTRYYGTEFFPSFGSWRFFQYIWDRDPSAGPGAWTESVFNSAEFGVEHTT